MPEAWVFNGAIYLFKTGLLDAVEPSLYGDRVAAYPIAPPYGLNLDDAADWNEAERILAGLA
jgi:CMP-N-acetylneuraminic acid synthetase